MTDAWRLTFAYHGDDFTLKSVRRLTKRIPRSQPIDGNHSACDVELRGSTSTVDSSRFDWTPSAPWSGTNAAPGDDERRILSIGEFLDELLSATRGEAEGDT